MWGERAKSLIFVAWGFGGSGCRPQEDGLGFRDDSVPLLCLRNWVVGSVLSSFMGEGRALEAPLGSVI